MGIDICKECLPCVCLYYSIKEVGKNGMHILKY